MGRPVQRDSLHRIRPPVGYHVSETLLAQCVTSDFKPRCQANRKVSYVSLSPSSFYQADGPYLPVDFFKGNDWEDCTAFIQAIRQAAWAESRLQDPLWMANLASLYFSGRALSWHAKLPLDVRQDWFKLEGALVDRWAPADEADEFVRLTLTLTT